MEIKGTALLAIRDYVKNNHRDKYEEWLSLLPGESKEIFNNTIDSTNWYIAETAASIPTKTICDMFFTGNVEKGAWESGRYSAEKALTGIYKIFIKASSPHFILARAKDIFARYYRPCEMIIYEKFENGTILHIINLKNSELVIEYRIGGWMEKALEISGCKNIKIDITKSVAKGDDVIEYVVNWEV